MLVEELFEALNLSRDTQKLFVGIAEQIHNMKKNLETALQSFAIAIPNFSEVVKGLSETIQKAEEYNNNLRNAGYTGALYVFHIADIVESIGAEDTKGFDDAIYRKTIEAQFCEGIISSINSSQVMAHRSKIIEEAILLHKEGRYFGSVTLLLTQIEGVFNDFMIHMDLAKYGENGTLISGKSKFRGIREKIEGIRSSNIEGAEFIVDLESTNFSPNDASVFRINSFRNAALHGSSTNFGTQISSTQALLWLYAAITEISYLTLMRDNLHPRIADDNL